MKKIFNHAFLSNCFNFYTRLSHTYTFQKQQFMSAAFPVSHALCVVQSLLASAHVCTRLNETACVKPCGVLCLQQWLFSFWV